METAKRVLVAIRPRSLFASAAPVAITLALLALKDGSVRAVTRVDALCTLAIAVLVQMTVNLNASYSNFHRAFNPMQAPKTKDNKIVINILSDKILRMWSWLFLALIFALIAVAQLTGRRKKLHVAGFSTALAVVSFLYCRRTKPLAAVGVQELVFGLAYGPIAMASTALVVVGSVPIGVALYSIAVLCFAVAFQILQSTADAPFARRLGIEASSLAVTLGFDRAFQAFVLFITCAYGVLALSILVQGHLPNVVLLLTMGSVRDICDAFREEKVRQLPDQLATLAAQLSSGLIISIALSSWIV